MSDCVQISLMSRFLKTASLNAKKDSIQGRAAEAKKQSENASREFNFKMFQSNANHQQLVGGRTKTIWEKIAWLSTTHFESAEPSIVPKLKMKFSRASLSREMIKIMLIHGSIKLTKGFSNILN